MMLLLDIVTLSLISFLPSALMQAFQLDSLAMGVILTAIIPLALISISDLAKTKAIKIHRKNIIIFMIFVAFAIIHSIPPLIFNDKLENNRLTIGYISVLLLAISSQKIYKKALNIIPMDFEIIMKSQLFLFALNFAFTLFGRELFTATTTKPAFFFSEPSHLAIAFSPVFIYFVCTKKIFGIFLLVLYSFICLKIENMTMLISIFLGLLTRISVKISIFILALVFFFIITTDSLSYFYDRISLTTNTNNLSALVLMQGWENALLSLNETFFWGAGFQQSGISTKTGEISSIIFSMFGVDYNLKDGGSTAAKLIGELGFSGIALVAIYLFIFLESFQKLKKLQRSPFVSNNHICIYTSSIIISYSLEMFVRGVGYFSLLSLLFYSSIWHHFLTNNNTHRKEILLCPPN